MHNKYVLVIKKCYQGNWGEQHYDVEDDIEDRDHNVGKQGQCTIGTY